MSSTEQTQLGESEQVTLKTDTDTPTLHKPFIRGHVQCGVELYDHATMSRGEARDGVWTLQVSAALDGDLARAARNELEAMQTEIDETALRAGRIGTMHVDSVHEQIPGWTLDAAFVRGDA